MPTTTSGKNVDLSKSNLRIIVKDGLTQIHYATEKGSGRECGDQVLGIDKGSTEAFTDSDGQHPRQNGSREIWADLFDDPQKLRS